MVERRLEFAAGLSGHLIDLCCRALPGQAFGVLSGPRAGRVESIHPFTRNLRSSDPEIDAILSSYGEFYRDPDRGFLADSQEQLRIFREIEARREVPVAIYHSHRTLAAAPTPVDVDLHYDGAIAAVIVSLAEPDRAELRAFRIGEHSWQEIPVWDATRPRPGFAPLAATPGESPSNADGSAPMRSR